MKEKLVYATLCLIVVSGSLFGQSVPVGQITRQMTKKQSEAVQIFKNTLNDQLASAGGNNVSDEAANTLLDSVDKAPNVAAAKTIALKNLPSNSPDNPNAKSQATIAINTATTQAKATVPQPCQPNSDKTYTFKFWFPLAPCFGNNDAINNFYKVSGGLSIANTVGYLYNPDQSTNQISSDLFNATFSQGFQAILSGTATQGSSQPSTSVATSTTSSATAGTTDSVSTAVSKLEQGGDFNLRFPYPILFKATSNYGIYMLTSPNVGFMVNGSSGQNTVTQSTEYNVNVPLEFFAETTSIAPQGSASNTQSGTFVLYLDVRPSAEVVSPAFANAIGLKSSRYFFLGQASAGLSINQSMRVGFQYYFGPSQIYQVPTTTGPTTTKTGKVGGVHLVVTFTPNKSKS